MNGILYFMLFVCYIQVQCKDKETKDEPCFLNHKHFHEQESNKVDVKNNTSVDYKSSKIELNNENEKSKSRKVRSAQDSSFQKEPNNTKENGTFNPDLKLVDYKKIYKEYETSSPSSNDIKDFEEKDLISLDEAMRLTKHKLEPVKPTNFTVHVPTPSGPGYTEPHGYGISTGPYNFESRKLFERPNYFGSNTMGALMTNNEKTITNKSVKKDLSKDMNKFLPLFH